MMTKKKNKGSRNQNAPEAGNSLQEFSNELTAGDNSKGKKRNKNKK